MTDRWAEDGIFDEMDIYRRYRVDDAWTIVGLPLFRPDVWLANLRLLRPLFVRRELGGVPKPLVRRIGDAHASFLFGNYYACVTTCRSVVEAVLRDSNVVGRFDAAPQGRELQELCKTLRIFDEGLGEAADFVRKWGNAALHATDEGKLAEYPSNRKIAVKCMERTMQLLDWAFSAQ